VPQCRVLLIILCHILLLGVCLFHCAIPPQGVIKQLRPPVAVIGPWPAPLVIPEAVDDLSNADVPRGFICPITQSIMRQPALLLHDGTVTPSTYDKEAIQQWLAQHRCGGGTTGGLQCRGQWGGGGGLEGAGGRGAG